MITVDDVNKVYTMNISIDKQFNFAKSSKDKIPYLLIFKQKFEKKLFSYLNWGCIPGNIIAGALREQTL